VAAEAEGCVKEILKADIFLKINFFLRSRFLILNGLHLGFLQVLARRGEEKGSLQSG
jgi:hypothetical protein